MKNTEQKEPIPFEVYWRRKRIKKIMRWVIPILLIAAWMAVSPIVKRPFYKNRVIKMFHQKESSFLREVDIPDEMRLPPELIRQAVDEYDAAGGKVEIEETPSGKLLMQTLSDASYQAYGVRMETLYLFNMSRVGAEKRVKLFYLGDANYFWHYYGDGAIRRSIFVPMGGGGLAKQARNL